MSAGTGNGGSQVADHSRIDISTDVSSAGATLRLVGDFDGRSTPVVRDALYDQLSVHQQVVVDLTGVEGVDLTALRVLAAASHAASRTGHHVVLRGCSPAVRRLLHLTHLIRAVEVERVAVGA